MNPWHLELESAGKPSNDPQATPGALIALIPEKGAYRKSQSRKSSNLQPKYLRIYKNQHYRVTGEHRSRIWREQPCDARRGVIDGEQALGTRARIRELRWELAPYRWRNPTAKKNILYGPSR